MSTQIRVAVLDDHQTTIDGYRFRFADSTSLEIVATITYGSALESTLDEQEVDVLILDINVPISQNDPNPYPIFKQINSLKEKHSDLIIIVISMHAERMLIKALMECGINGYILKDDHKTIRNLENIISSVTHGDIFLSSKVKGILFNKTSNEYSLTTRQLQILSLYAANPELTSAAVARELNISSSTVRNLLSSAYTRLKVPNLSAAVTKARQIGIITPYPPIYQSSSLTDES